MDIIGLVFLWHVRVVRVVVDMVLVVLVVMVEWVKGPPIVQLVKLMGV